MPQDAQNQPAPSTPAVQVQPGPQPAPVPAPPNAAQTQANASAPAPADDPLPPGTQLDNKGRVQVLTQSVFKKLKAEAREKGARDVLSSVATKAGVKIQYRQGMSLDEYRTAIEDAITEKLNSLPSNSDVQDNPPQDQPQKPTNQQNNRNDRRVDPRWERERTHLMQDRDDLSRRLKSEANGRKELQRQLDAKDAEMALRESAVMAGVKDVDYAIRLLTRSLENKSEQDLAKFDEGAFFSGLRSSHPYLFAEVVKPVTTGTGTNNSPSPPTPGAVSQTVAQNGQVDVRKMTKEDYLKHLASRGLAVQV